MAGLARFKLDHKLMLFHTFAAVVAALRFAATAASNMSGCFAALLLAVASLRLPSASAPATLR